MAPARLIVEMVRAVLETAPAQLAADLVDRGITLTGGGSLLRGFCEFLHAETLLPVMRAADPLNCVVLGAGKFLEQVDRIRPSLGFVPQHRFNTV
jgi:rod shape-determining protein MreB